MNIFDFAFKVLKHYDIVIAVVSLFLLMMGPSANLGVGGTFACIFCIVLGVGVRILRIYLKKRQ